MSGGLTNLRLGSISYINSLPVDLGLLDSKISLPQAQFISGFPSDLNQKMLSGVIDLGPISSFWYAKHRELFFVLPDLSISSESGVQSVLLFSRYPLRELSGKRILASGQGKTTPVLLEIICRSFYGFTPQIVLGGDEQDDLLGSADAALVIGDQALLMRQKYKSSGLIVTDLAEEWRARTGEPFVFAVWVVRRDFFRRDPEGAAKALSALLESKRWGQSHLSEILDRACTSTGLSKEVLIDYFSHLSYGFNVDLQKGMRGFFEEAARLNLLSSIPQIEFMPDPALVGKP